MPQELLFQAPPEIAVNELLLKQHIAKLIRVDSKEIQHISILKRSIDARQKAVKINLKVSIFLQGENFVEHKLQLPEYKNVVNSQEVIIVGAGPAGLFAALQLIELGLKPIVIERGKEVRRRRGQERPDRARTRAALAAGERLPRRGRGHGAPQAPHDHAGLGNTAQSLPRRDGPRGALGRGQGDRRDRPSPRGERVREVPHRARPPLRERLRSHRRRDPTARRGREGHTAQRKEAMTRPPASRRLLRRESPTRLGARAILAAIEAGTTWRDVETTA